MKVPYIILEVANTHGGDPDYVHQLIDAFSAYQQSYGIKFQAFHHDLISLKDFAAYADYKKLHINGKQWERIILSASKTKDVWLDIFDSYGIDVLKENLVQIHGIKLQSSVLQNYEVLAALQEVDLSRKRVIINIAARSINEISEIADHLDLILNPKELLIEVGFQAYPTKIQDSGISKIRELKKAFPYRIVFADHTDGQSDDAIWLPVVALMEGSDVIEKHIMLDNVETKYDRYSSLNHHRFDELTKQLQRFSELKAKSFVNEKEKKYLEHSLMVPVLKTQKTAQSLIKPKRDFIFRRTSQKGLSINQIQSKQKELNVLCADIESEHTLQETDFRPARIGSIIACRMKSRRLPQKALVPIQGIPAVELCLKNTLKIKNIISVTLASSHLKEDAVLQDHCYNSSVKFYAGNPVNVIQRFYNAALQEKLDVVVRQTADNIFMSDEIFQILLASHFETGADFTTAKVAAIGTNFEIISIGALTKLNELFPNADYSEYMTWYFVNNPDYFHINKVVLPEEYIRNYRLTLDYPEDFQMINRILSEISNGIEAGLPEVFCLLDQNPEISQINQNMDVIYKTNTELIDKLNSVTRIKIN